MPFTSPQIPAAAQGRRIARGMDSTTSRKRESSVDSTGLPRDCRKIKAALLTQSRIIMQRYIRKASLAKSKYSGLLSVPKILISCTGNS